MVELQANTAVLAAVAGKAPATGGGEDASSGFFAQALAAAIAPTADAKPGAAAAQPLVLGLPLGFAAQALAAQAAQAAGKGQAAQGKDLLAALGPGDQSASALFDKLAAQLAAQGAGGGDPKEVAAQLVKLGLSPGELKQLVVKSAQNENAGADDKSLESLLQQIAQELGAGQSPDPALLGAVAAQLNALQAATQGGGKAADIAAEGKDLPVAGAKSPTASLASDLPETLAKNTKNTNAAVQGREALPVSDDKPGVAVTAADGAALKAFAGKLAAASGEQPNLAIEGGVNATTATASHADAGAVRTDGIGITAPQRAVQDPAAQAALQVRTPVRAPGWEAEFSQKVVWMAGRDTQSAQLMLNPPQLGPVEVRLTMSGGEAGAQFFSPHQNVREAIESAMPRLRDMMAEAGLSLGQTSVSSESFRDQRPAQGNAQQSVAQEGGGEAQETASSLLSLNPSQGVRLGRGLVDLYA